MRTDVDLRVWRTRKLVQAAFIGLVEERGFAAITVRDIAQRAMINRATFYRHYQDKYDLVEQIFQEVVTWWLESDMAYTPVQVATWFRRFVLRGYHYALEGSVTPGNSISPQHGLE